MHEFHLAHNIIKIALSVLEKEQGKRIKKITVILSEKDHLTPENFQKLLKDLAEKEVFKETIFEVKKGKETLIKEIEIEK